MRKIADRRICGLFYFVEQSNSILITDSILEENINPCLSNNGCVNVTGSEGDCLSHKNLTRILAANEADIVLFLVKNRYHPFLIKRFLKKNNLEYLSSCIVIPSFKNPRWLLPAHKDIIKKSRDIMKPSKVKSLLALWLFHLLNIIGYPQLIFPSQLIISKRKKSNASVTGILNEFLTKKLGRKNLKTVLYSGSYGVYQKFTAQIIDKHGETIAYAKIGQGMLAKKTMEDEVRALNYLDNINFSALKHPEIISVGQLDNTSDLIMLQTPSPVNYKKFRKRLCHAHIAALEELFLKTKKNASGNMLLEDMENDLHRLADKMIIEKDKFTRLLETSLKKLRKAIGKKDLVLGFSQGDFAPWNMFIGDSGLFVFDWEISTHRVPMWDLYNFVLHSEVLIFSKKHKDILSLIFDKDSIYAALISQYQKCFDKSMYFNKKVFLVITLYQIMIYYIEYTILQNEFSFQMKSTDNDLLETASAMMQEALNNIEK